MRSKPMILAALLLAAFLVNLDTTMVNVVLPARASTTGSAAASGHPHAERGRGGPCQPSPGAFRAQLITVVGSGTISV